MDHSEIFGRPKSKDTRIRSNDAVDRQTQLRNTCDVTDSIPSNRV